LLNDPERIGIVGHGYVGEAISQSIIYPLEKIIVDPFKGYTSSYHDIKKECSSIFVCVPSPQLHDGSCDTSIVEEVFEKLQGYQGVVISKVTAPPDFYEEWGKKLPNLVYIPEFLRANTSVTDFHTAEWIIVGGTVSAYQREAVRIISHLQPNIKRIEYCEIGQAAFVKYSINTFLATKVVFMNELYQLAEKKNYNWDHISLLISLDKRIGDSHMKVPGPDTHYGFGGSCFPKDTDALLKYAEEYGVNLNTLNAAAKKNTLLRLTKPK